MTDAEVITFNGWGFMPEQIAPYALARVGQTSAQTPGTRNRQELAHSSNVPSWLRDPVSSFKEQTGCV